MQQQRDKLLALARPVWSGQVEPLAQHGELAGGRLAGFGTLLEVVESPGWQQLEVVESPGWQQLEVVESPDWQQMELVESPDWRQMELKTIPV